MPKEKNKQIISSLMGEFVLLYISGSGMGAAAVFERGDF
jgi:hypothetical protein